MIFTDIRMPVMDGLELIEHLRKKFGDSKQIVLLTGYDEFTYAKFGLQHGVQDYLLKPVVAKEFYMSPNYFSRMFKERAGENYKDYLTMVRIGYARELLEKTNYDMETISYAVGYGNAKYFSNVFYKRMGVRPFEYRREYREGKKKP